MQEDAIAHTTYFSVSTVNGCLAKLNNVAFFFLRFESVQLLFPGYNERQNCEQPMCFVREIKANI